MTLPNQPDVLQEISDSLRASRKADKEQADPPVPKRTRAVRPADAVVPPASPDSPAVDVTEGKGLKDS